MNKKDSPFKFNDYVEITEGFYKGNKGHIVNGREVSISCEELKFYDIEFKYDVEFKSSYSKTYVSTFNENELKKAKLKVPKRKV